MPELSSLPDQSASPNAGLEFHDIKPLPTFSPFPWTYVWSGIGVLACLLLFLLLKKIRQNRNQLAAEPLRLPPADEALAELNRLNELRREGRISLRDLSSRVSLLLRLYLERRMGFPAVEQTAFEVGTNLPLALARALPVLAKERHIASTNRVKALLRNLERFTFADTSTEYFHLESNEVNALFPEVETIIREFETALKREEERTRSVIDSSQGSVC